jgi:hypothetical protein
VEEIVQNVNLSTGVIQKVNSDANPADATRQVLSPSNATETLVNVTANRM